MGIAIVDAVGLAKDNKRAFDALAARQDALVSRMTVETSALERARAELYESALVPFQRVFSQLKNVDLAELAAIDELPSGALPDLELRQVRVSLTRSAGALAGSALAGAGAGAGTYAAVGALATASTGTAISSLSGAAATSATLAWLGGGSLAAGGGGVAAGTTVLAGIVAAPVVLGVAGVLSWQGRKARAGQRETAARINQAASELNTAEQTAATVRRRSRQTRALYRDLRQAMTRRLADLAGWVAANVDYATWSLEQRRVVARLVEVVSLAVMVMAAPIADDAGQPIARSRELVLEVKQRLLVMAAI